MKLNVIDKFNVEKINENFRMIAEYLGDTATGTAKETKTDKVNK